MASADSSAPLHGRKRNYDDFVIPFDDQQPVLDVEPLSYVPYSGLPLLPRDYPSTSVGREPQAEEREHGVDFSPEVVLTGSAAIGKAGPIVGLVDIGESGDSYFFRVSLPGVPKNNDQPQCKIEANGKVLIEGFTVTGEKKVHKNHHNFKMLSRNLCPPGQFSISFQLPGPVNQEQFAGHCGFDGTFEGIVKKS